VATHTPSYLLSRWIFLRLLGLTYLVAFASLGTQVVGLIGADGIFTGTRMLNLMRNPGAEHMDWFYSHMGSMLGGGIAFHTAFAVFGLQRIWDYSFAGALGVLPWTLPTLIGVPGIVLGTRHYRRKFRRGPARAAG